MAFLQQNKYDQLIPMVEYISGIPRNIFQTFKTKELPIELSENIAKLKALNPTWQYSLFDDDDIESFICTEYSTTIFQLYKRISADYGAARADLFRYLLIYKRGGVYLDIKSSLSKALDKVLMPNDKLVLSHWDNGLGCQHENWGYYRDIKFIKGGEFQQWHIIAAPGHPFIRAVICQVLYNIDHYTPFKYGVGLIGTLRTTGPICYSKVMSELTQKFVKDYRVVDGVDDIGLIYSIFEDEKGSNYHKTILRSDYNKYSSIIENGKPQSIIVIYYFKYYYLPRMRFEAKLDIIQREYKMAENKIIFIAQLFSNRARKLFKLHKK